MLLVDIFSGDNRSRIVARIPWYSRDCALVSSGAFKYFSNRASKTRLLLRLQVCPSQLTISLAGSKIGTSLPRNFGPDDEAGAAAWFEAGAAGGGAAGGGAAGCWSGT